MAIWKPEDIEVSTSAGARATLGEAIGAGFAIAVPQAGFAPEAKVLNEVYQPLTDFVQPYLFNQSQANEATQLGLPAPQLSYELSGALASQNYQPDDATFDRLVGELEALRVKLPEEATPQAISARREMILADYREAQAKNEEILSRASPGARIAGQLIGGIGAEFTDVGNLLTAPLGAPARIGLLATLGIEATVNAVIEGVQTPGRNRFLDLIGEERQGVLQNMVQGATFGAVLGGTVKLGGRLVAPAARLTRSGAETIGRMFASPAEQRALARDAVASGDPELQQIGEAVLRDLEDQEAAVTNPDVDTIREHAARAQEALDVAAGDRPLTMPDRPILAVPSQSIVNGQIVEVNPRELLVQPEVFQFKSEVVAPGGVTPKLQQVTQWDPSRAGVVVVYQYTDGTRAIADGHQRTALANRIMDADPGQEIRMAAYVMREDDGFSVADVRVLAALKNIAEAADGMTSRMALDAAKVLRIRPDAIGQLPSGPGIRRARELSSLSDEAFDMTINRVVPEDQAALVGRMVTDQAMQGPIMKLLARTSPETAGQAESIISQALNAPTARETMADLFGETEVIESLYLERAKVLERTLRALRDDKSVFRTLTDKAGTIEGAGNKLDASTNQKIRNQVEQSLAAVKALAHRAGPISEALNDAAKAYRENGRLKDAADTVSRAVRDEVSRNGLSGARAGTDGSSPKPASESQLAFDPNGDFAEIDGPGVEAQIEATKIQPDPAPVDPAAPQPGSRAELRELAKAGASREVLDNHPAVVAALDELQARPETHKMAGYGSEAWYNDRVYTIEGEAIKGTDEALRHWEQQAEELAWVESNLPPEAVARDRQLTIILGPPAAGKSTIANKIAIASRAAILDSDEIKKALPEFDGGVGANAVHEESGDLANMLSENMRLRGTNIILPKVGDKLSSIQKQIDLYRGSGYTVRIVNMAVSPENAYQRMIGRFAATGRIIPPSYVDYVGAKPSETYRRLREAGAENGYTEIDNNGGYGDPKRITDQQGENALAGTPYDTGPGGEQGSGPVGRTEGGDGAVAPQASPQSELTPAGEQTLFPGVDPITARDRLQAKANAPLQARPRQSDTEIGGLFDPNDPSRFDLFDTVPVGRSFADDGKPVSVTVSRQELVAELDAEDALVREIEACLLGGA
jgi:hypothetical protein